jgi:hypothetical protein
MVNVERDIFSLTIDKTAKNRRKRGNPLLAHTLPKERRRRQYGMKKGLVSIFCLLVLTLTALPMEVGAQTRYRRFDNSGRYEQRIRNYRYGDRVYSGRRYRRWDQDRSFWDRHRDKLTTAIGAGAGAAVGAAVGGKKGAIIGAIVGGGGSAIYTYGIRDRNRRRY